MQACQGGTWKALTRRSVSSTERPTGRSLMVIWRSTPVGEMMNRPLHQHPNQCSVPSSLHVAQDDAEEPGTVCLLPLT